MSDNPTVYQRIMRAAEIGKGVRLSFTDCLRLSRDVAIISRAEQDDAGQDEDAPHWHSSRLTKES